MAFLSQQSYCILSLPVLAGAIQCYLQIEILILVSMIQLEVEIYFISTFILVFFGHPEVYILINLLLV